MARRCRSAAGIQCRGGADPSGDRGRQRTDCRRAHPDLAGCAYADVLPAGYLAAFDLAEWTARRRRGLESRTPPSEVFVAEADGTLVGHAAVGPFRTEEGAHDTGVCEVAAIYVEPTCWSTGAGLALMRASMAHLVGHGFAEIRLWVVADNPRARRFYERFGFALDGTSRTQPIGPGYEDVAPIRHVRYTLHVAPDAARALVNRRGT